MSQAPVGSGILQGKVAIGTGSGRGVGMAIAEALAKNGAAVAVTARTESEISDVASRIIAAGGRAIAISGDVTDRRAVERRLGPVEILVNNAGEPGLGGPLWEADPDEWWRTLEVNLKGPDAVLASGATRHDCSTQRHDHQHR